jgi:hypothetical protein
MHKIKIHITGNKYMEELINSFTKLRKFSCLQGEFETEWGSEQMYRSCSSSNGQGDWGVWLGRTSSRGWCYLIGWSPLVKKKERKAKHPVLIVCLELEVGRPRAYCTVRVNMGIWGGHQPG